MVVLVTKKVYSSRTAILDIWFGFEDFVFYYSLTHPKSKLDRNLGVLQISEIAPNETEAAVIFAVASRGSLCS